MRIIKWLSPILFFLGLGVLVLIFSPVLVQEAGYRIKNISPPEYRLIESQEEAKEVREGVLTYRSKLLIPKSFDFSLVVPKIGVNAQVFPNINSADEKEYLPVLKKGVAHAKGSRLPDQPGVVFIFAHSTDSFYNISHYNAVFFLLTKLEENNEAYLFYKNKKYHYRVVEKKVVADQEIQREIESLEGNFLVLQTCHPPGTTLKRLIVIAKAV